MRGGLVGFWGRIVDNQKNLPINSFTFTGSYLTKCSNGWSIIPLTVNAFEHIVLKILLNKCCRKFVLGWAAGGGRLMDGGVGSLLFVNGDSERERF